MSFQTLSYAQSRFRKLPGSHFPNDERKEEQYVHISTDTFFYQLECVECKHKGNVSGNFKFKIFDKKYNKGEDWITEEVEVEGEINPEDDVAFMMKGLTDHGDLSLNYSSKMIFGPGTVFLSVYEEKPVFFECLGMDMSEVQTGFSNLMEGKNLALTIHCQSRPKKRFKLSIELEFEEEQIKNFFREEKIQKILQFLESFNPQMKLLEREQDSMLDDESLQLESESRGKKQVPFYRSNSKNPRKKKFFGIF